MIHQYDLIPFWWQNWWEEGNKHQGIIGEWDMVGTGGHVGPGGGLYPNFCTQVCQHGLEPIPFLLRNSRKRHPFSCIFWGRNTLLFSQIWPKSTLFWTKLLKTKPRSPENFGELLSLPRNTPFLLHFCPKNIPFLLHFLSKSHPWCWHTRSTVYIVSAPPGRGGGMVLPEFLYMGVPLQDFKPHPFYNYCRVPGRRGLH